MSDVMLRPDNMPDYLKEESNNRIQFEQGDILIPRLSLCQANSFEKNPGHPRYIKGVTDGDWFNTLSKVIYGKKVNIIPILPYHSRIKFLSKDDATIICSSPDGKTGGRISPNCNSCIHSQWSKQGDKQIPPECIRFSNYLCFILNGDKSGQVADTAVLSLKKTAIKASKLFNTMINARGKAPYAGVYEFSSVTEQNAKHQMYFIPVVNNAGWATKEWYIEGEKMFESYQNRTIVADQEEPAQTQQENQLSDDMPF